MILLLNRLFSNWHFIYVDRYSIFISTFFDFWLDILPFGYFVHNGKPYKRLRLRLIWNSSYQSIIVMIVIVRKRKFSDPFDYNCDALLQRCLWQCFQFFTILDSQLVLTLFMHQLFETPAPPPPHLGLSRAFTFYASESEWIPRFPGTKVRGAFPRPYFSTNVTPFVKQLIIAKRYTLVKKHCRQPWNKQIDLWAAI